MDKTQVIIFVVAILFLAFRIYQKYIKKDSKGAANDKKKSSDATYFSVNTDDDYEPYSKK